LDSLKNIAPPSCLFQMERNRFTNSSREKELFIHREQEHRILPSLEMYNADGSDTIEGTSVSLRVMEVR
jgi:hypothetical protein